MPAKPKWTGCRLTLHKWRATKLQPRPTLLPPGTFHPGDDLDLWSFRRKVFLSSVPSEQHGQFIPSRLDDYATRRLLHSGLSLSALLDTPWTHLASLFFSLPPSSVFRTRFFNRNQHPGESAGKWADALQDLAARHIPRTRRTFVKRTQPRDSWVRNFVGKATGHYVTLSNSRGLTSTCMIAKTQPRVLLHCFRQRSVAAKPYETYRTQTKTPKLLLLYTLRKQRQAS
ncbi:hypothetical protein CRM22_001885 [Opisthorchis felineus]|uniref:Uncharacterized protein n=1 Tax=Opisthorchis felineus TaxID=147828 RepID=A0A4S2M8P7_OPIFE|nr:hypothetical protein CRM22_001885 [Opisthorchis felineus]